MVRACPEFVGWAASLGGSIRNWHELCQAADTLRPLAGISDTAWRSARDTLGDRTAAAAVALVFDKSCRGEVLTTDAYLRAMVRRAETGELHLYPSFHGRSRRMAA